MASGEWVFDDQVADRFEDMLSRSIPDLPQLRRIISDVAQALVPFGGVVVDHGCSLGQTLDSLAGFGRELYGFDKSTAMVDRAKTQMAGRARIAHLDLVTGKPEHPPADLTSFVFTLQFIAEQERVGILARALAASKPGSLLIVAEKVTTASQELAPVLTGVYHERKHQAGYTWPQIEAKAASLAGVLRPLTARENEEAIEAAGWSKPECIWRSLNFAAWAAVAPAR